MALFGRLRPDEFCDQRESGSDPYNCYQLDLLQFIHLIEHKAGDAETVTFIQINRTSPDVFFQFPMNHCPDQRSNLKRACKLSIKDNVEC